jgi:hypothetical protein
MLRRAQYAVVLALIVLIDAAFDVAFIKCGCQRHVGLLHRSAKGKGVVFDADSMRRFAG